MASGHALLTRIVHGQHVAAFAALCGAAQRNGVAVQAVVRAFNDHAVAGHHSGSRHDLTVLGVASLDAAVDGDWNEVLLATDLNSATKKWLSNEFSLLSCFFFILILISNSKKHNQHKSNTHTNEPVAISLPCRSIASALARRKSKCPPPEMSVACIRPGSVPRISPLHGRAE